MDVLSESTEHSKTAMWSAAALLPLFRVARTTLHPAGLKSHCAPQSLRKVEERLRASAAERIAGCRRDGSKKLLREYPRARSRGTSSSSHRRTWRGWK